LGPGTLEIARLNVGRTQPAVWVSWPTERAEHDRAEDAAGVVGEREQLLRRDPAGSDDRDWTRGAGVERMASREIAQRRSRSESTLRY